MFENECPRFFELSHIFFDFIGRGIHDVKWIFGCREKMAVWSILYFQIKFRQLEDMILKLVLKNECLRTLQLSLFFFGLAMTGFNDI